MYIVYNEKTDQLATMEFDKEFAMIAGKMYNFTRAALVLEEDESGSGRYYNMLQLDKFQNDGWIIVGTL